MATLDITLRGVTADSTISIRVQLDGVEKNRPLTVTPINVTAKGGADLSSAKKTSRASAVKRNSARTTDRLLPTDKLVLDALRARVPEGAAETAPVTIRELMRECFISRRQVGICLRRLNEKGMINRIGDDALSGRVEGYCYRIQD
jgi:predicted HTH transcriptional regulator